MMDQPAQKIRIKICGVTSAEDALLAVDAGADYLGLIFVERSPRCVGLESALRIVEAVQSLNASKSTKIVGVFQDPSLAEILSIHERLSLDLIQLHGLETPEFCAELPVPVIKHIPLSQAGNPADALADYRSVVQAFLVEPPKESRLSTKDWLSQEPKRVAQLQELFKIAPCFLAGGLMPDNVSAVLNGLRPFAVDVASGIETSPGVKDLQKMQQFCVQVQEISNRQPDGVSHSCNL